VEVRLVVVRAGGLAILENLRSKSVGGRVKRGRAF
jgi:hypothetical protein